MLFERLEAARDGQFDFHINDSHTDVDVMVVTFSLKSLVKYSITLMAEISHPIALAHAQGLQARKSV
ncbi:hypothetical protein [Sphingomonas sp. CFBP 8764]|uniref:hypothetical protein n=1 Tax=Sphingomonas sp. CFBP 8764 TaxID=2775275 RepID=UPI001780E32B|nr:hypothetical protein [Sphingomonas sp. CFBP 8764]MBD8551948.1 hypothetical protein [Sphingomonas sp. CFBP 8764]